MSRQAADPQRRGCDAIAEGGPMDGMVLGIAGPHQFDVVMADRIHWRYIRSDREIQLPGSVTAQVYRCSGRVSA